MCSTGGVRTREFSSDHTDELAPRINETDIGIANFTSTRMVAPPGARRTRVCERRSAAQFRRFSMMTTGDIERVQDAHDKAGQDAKHHADCKGMSESSEVVMNGRNRRRSKAKASRLWIGRSGGHDQLDDDGYDHA